MVGLAGLGAATALRIWTLRTLGDSWSTRVTRFAGGDRRVVTDGPYRFIRHPNYVALGLEFFGLPLIGGAYLSAVGLGLANAALLRQRIVQEDALLMAIPGYRQRMGDKPALIPRLLSGR